MVTGNESSSLLVDGIEGKAGLRKSEGAWLTGRVRDNVVGALSRGGGTVANGSVDTRRDGIDGKGGSTGTEGCLRGGGRRTPGNGDWNEGLRES